MKLRSALGSRRELLGRWICLAVLVTPQGIVGQALSEHRLDSLRPTVVLALGDAPEVSIGDDSAPEYQLFRVSGAVRLMDGRFAILNGGSNEIRIFTPEGRFIIGYGGQGEGPGEFMAADRLFLGRADSLIIWDSRSVRASVFTADAGFVRTIPLKPRPRIPRLEGVDGRGDLLIVARNLPTSSASGISRLVESRMFYSPAGELLDSLGTAPGLAGEIHSTGESIEILRPLVAPTTTYAIGGSTLWVETGEGRRLEFFDLDSGVGEVITWDGPDLSMTPEYRQAIIDEAVARVPEERRPRVRASVERRPVPETIPATRRVISDGEGRGWLELASTPGRDDPGTWIIFNPDGSLAARLDLPVATSLQSVLDGAVLVVERDDLDVEHVRVYRLSGG